MQTDPTPFIVPSSSLWVYSWTLLVEFPLQFFGREFRRTWHTVVLNRCLPGKGNEDSQDSFVALHV